MRRLLTAIFIFIAILCVGEVEAKQPKKQKYPTMIAHRGCWSKNAEGEFVIPENSVAAVAMAKRMGYAGIECDVHYTKDKRMVILHDLTLNRTVRKATDYSKLDKPVYLSELTFEELRRDYVLESTNPNMRTPIPTLEELLEECKRQGITPMLHSDLWESYEVVQRMFGDEWICFAAGVEHMQKVRKFSDCTILLTINDGSAEENIARLQQIGGRCGISTMNYDLYTPQFCKALTDAGYQVQASIFPASREATAQLRGITYQLTDFSFMPPVDRRSDYRMTINFGWLNAVGLGMSYKLPPKNHHFECGGVVAEVTTRKKSDVKISADIGGQKYDNLPAIKGKMTLYIGRRFFDDAAPKININHSNIGHLRFGVKRVRYYFYEM